MYFSSFVALIVDPEEMALGEGLRGQGSEARRGQQGSPRNFSPESLAPGTLEPYVLSFFCPFSSNSLTSFMNSFTSLKDR